MSDSISHKFSDTDPTLSATVTGEISVAVVIIFLMLFVIALILYLRFKGYSGPIGSYNSRSRNLVFTPNQPDIPRKPLDPLILDSLPVITFHTEDLKEEGSVECAICLSELTDGETARFLPRCKHGFHVECIDMWFHSNSTCPLCRSPVRADDDVEPFMKIPVPKYGHLAELQDSKASFDEGSSSSGNSFSEKEQKGMLVIEIPTWQESSSSSNTPLASSPALERLRTLQSILSRGNLNDVGVSSSCSPRGYDIGQGGMQTSLPVSESDGHSLV